MVGGGRNCGEPIARLRDTGGSRHHIAHLLHGPLGRLLCCRQGYAIARTGKCRCAEGEGEHDAHASNRPAAHTTEPALCFHTLILIPFQIFASLFGAAFRTKKTTFSATNTTGGRDRKPVSIRPKKMFQSQAVEPRLCFIAPGTPGPGQLFVNGSRRFPF